ncbi:MAG: geranylgeranyl reductase family protein, partial [Nitriliruptorales bacterium]|nr:geranylgeranyl reductase family protein [Nitriliruptorales bacterium]
MPARAARRTAADVIVVGAGPGGTAAAAHLARDGHDVLVIEKDTFPREKVCGDGLTPRVVKELEHLGLDVEARGEPVGWAVQKGLRIHGGATVMELPWPELADWPSYGMTCTRRIFDETLARHAQAQGAQLREGTRVTGPLRHAERDGRIMGVTIETADGEPAEVLAPVVIAADGAGSGLGKAMGLHRLEDRPMAVAARSYWESPASKDEWMSSFLDLEDPDGNLLPGYGWIFPLDDGTINVGLGLLNTARNFQSVNYRRVLEQWAAGMAPEWGTGTDTQRGRIVTSPIPMGFNRVPLHKDGLLLVGDSGGMVNPFNGEGISYAMEAGRLAAEVTADALAASNTSRLDRYDA